MTDRGIALITGIAGFSGSHLAEYLLRNGFAVAGLELPGASTRNLAPVLDDVHLYRADLREEEAVRRILAEVRPAQVYHLAALLCPPAGEEWRALFDVNVYGTIHLLEAVRAECPDARVLVAGSAAQYGLVPERENPICEETPFRPVTPYGVSKVAQEMVAYQYGASGLHVVRVRTFNLLGPRQGPHLVGSALAQQIAAIEAGRQEPVIRVGALDTQRDFLDVRDAVRAYVLALEHGEPGAVFNVCSGQSRSIAELLEDLLALSKVRGIAVQQDPARLQPADVPLQVGDFSRLRERTGWRPEIPFEQSLRDLLQAWRAQIGG
ncbi:MAG: GDP-mannose 4,6-dehydratase [Chloroflexia bacterium]